MPLLLIASFALLWYAVHETAPLKPFPIFPAICCRSCRFWSSSGRPSSTSCRRASMLAWGHRGDCRCCSPGPFLRCRCRCGSTLPMPIRARSFRRSWRRVASARRSIATQTSRECANSFGYGLRPTKDHADIAVTSNLAHDRFDFLFSRAKALPPHFTAISSRSRILRFRMDGRTLGVFQSGVADRGAGRIGGEAGKR